MTVVSFSFYAVGYKLQLLASLPSLRESDGVRIWPMYAVLLNMDVTLCPVQPSDVNTPLSVTTLSVAAYASMPSPWVLVYCCVAYCRLVHGPGRHVFRHLNSQ